MYKELANKYLDVEKYLQELETNETRLNYQQEKFRLNKRKYNEGLITQIELNSIELDMDSAELNYLNSIAKVNLAKLLFRMMLA
jgi:outer membrane protein TolC